MNRTTVVNIEALWNRIEDYSNKIGRVATRPLLLLFFVMKSKKTPWKDKMLIMSTLSYLVFPIDFLDAKRLPIIGWFDEITSLSITIQKVRKNVTPEIEENVNDILDHWYPEYAEYIEVV